MKAQAFHLRDRADPRPFHVRQLAKPGPLHMREAPDPRPYHVRQMADPRPFHLKYPEEEARRLVRMPSGDIVPLDWARTIAWAHDELERLVHDHPPDGDAR